MKKSIFITREEGSKSVKYIYYVKKKTCLGVLDRRERDKNNEIGLK